jgi:hypothetical protein
MIDEIVMLSRRFLDEFGGNLKKIYKRDKNFHSRRLPPLAPSQQEGERNSLPFRGRVREGRKLTA